MGSHTTDTSKDIRAATTRYNKSQFFDNPLNELARRTGSDPCRLWFFEWLTQLTLWAHNGVESLANFARGCSVPRNRRGWEWRVCDQAGTELDKGREKTRTAARYRGYQAMFLLLASGVRLIDPGTSAP